MSNLLIVEDEAIIRQALRRLLERHGHQVEEAGSIGEAKESRLEDKDLVIADLRLPDGAGTELIELGEGTPVLIMTSYASVRSAVQSMKMGAVDYISKPFDHEEMVLLVERILRQSRLQRQNAALKSAVSDCYPVTEMVGDCPAMQAVFERIRRVAPTDTTVLILGESGTGKELVARALHESSPYRDGPFVPVNCASIPETLIESELFGHDRGAFQNALESRHGLVEAASGGTLFLDEVGELPLNAQARLLRVLQNGEVRRLGSDHLRQVELRVVAATHRQLDALVEEGLFREDLYFRLRVMEIRLPPLRERGDDIDKLAVYLLEKACRRLNHPPLRMSPEAMAAIRGYAWPGNVRELENAMERAAILCDDGVIGPDLLSIPENRPIPDGRGEETPSLSMDEYFVRFVRENEAHMTETELAKRLGISRKTLWERRQRLRIPRNR